MVDLKKDSNTFRIHPENEPKYITINVEPVLFYNTNEKSFFLSDFDTAEKFMENFPKEFGNELFIKYLDQAREIINNKKPLAFE